MDTPAIVPCKECVFFKPKDAAAAHPTGLDGKCHRRAPVSVGHVMNRFPWVKLDDGCGDGMTSEQWRGLPE